MDILEAQFNEVKKIVEKEAPTGRLKKYLWAAEDGELLDATTVDGPHGGVYVGRTGMINLQFVGYLTPKDGSGIGGHGAYSPIIPLDGKTVLDWVTAARTIYNNHGFDPILDFFIDERASVSSACCSSTRQT